MIPQKLLVPSDENILELVQTIKGKELKHEYEYTKSETKKGMRVIFSEEELKKNLKKEIFTIQ